MCKEKRLRTFEDKGQLLMRVDEGSAGVDLHFWYVSYLVLRILFRFINLVCSCSGSLRSLANANLYPYSMQYGVVMHMFAGSRVNSQRPLQLAGFEDATSVRARSSSHFGDSYHWTLNVQRTSSPLLFFVHVL